MNHENPHHPPHEGAPTDFEYHPVELSYEQILTLRDVFEEHGIFYHGTSNEDIAREILPPEKTFVISEVGRKKNLDQVFFTKDKNSAHIYADKAKKSYGGTPRVFEVLPLTEVITELNAQKGTSVYHADSAIVITPQLKNILQDLITHIPSNDKP